MRVPVTHELVAGHSVSRVLFHAFTAGALSAVVLLILDSVFRLPVASALYTAGAPAVSALVAAHYFRRGEAEEPLITAISFTGVAAVLDLVLSALARGRTDLLDPAFGFGFPLMLVFGVTGLTGELVPTIRRNRSA